MRLIVTFPASGLPFEEVAVYEISTLEPAHTVLLGGTVALFCFKNYFFGDINYFLDILRLGGWNHMDLYRDFVVFMPAFLYMGWHYLKNYSFNIVF